MKVKIGPYKDWFGPYQIADLLQKVGVSEDKCHDVGEFLANKTPLNRVCQWVDKVRGERKIEVKIDKYDTWNMDRTMIYIILPLLKQYRENMHGACGSLPEFSQTSNSHPQMCLDFYEEGDELAWKKGHEHWERIVDKMIWAFEHYEDEYDEIPGYVIEKTEFHENFSDNFVAVDDPEGAEKGYTQMKPKKEGVYNWEALEKHNDAISEGLNLFGKHYRSLWE